MAESAKWYVAHTYSGYENTVAASIEKAVENRGMRDLIHEVKIPLSSALLVSERIQDPQIRQSMREPLEKIRHLMNSALAGCKVQSQIFDLQIRPVHINECVIESIRNQQFFLIQKHFELDISAEDLTVYTDKEWADEPLDENEVNDLLSVLGRQLNLINGNITEKEYMEDNPIVDNEVILDRLEDMQENTERYTITDILNIVCYFEDISLYEEIKRKIENKEIGVENCYTNIKKMLEK